MYLRDGNYQGLFSSFMCLHQKCLSKVAFSLIIYHHYQANRKLKFDVQLLNLILFGEFMSFINKF